MTITDLPSRTTDVDARRPVCPLPAEHPPVGATTALDRADSRLSGVRHSVPAPRRQHPHRPAPRRPRRTTGARGPAAPGRVLDRHALRNAEPHENRSWDRMRFLPALPSDTEERDAVALEALHDAHRRSTHRPLPDPVRTAQAVVTAAAEVLAGWRPAEHLGRWTSPELYDAIARRAGLAHRVLGEAPAPRPRVRTIRVQLTASGACEVCAVLEGGERVRGAGARLEPHRGRWLLTNLEIA